MEDADAETNCNNFHIFDWCIDNCKKAGIGFEIKNGIGLTRRSHMFKLHMVRPFAVSFLISFIGSLSIVKRLGRRRLLS